MSPRRNIFVRGRLPASANNANSMPETAVSSPIESPWDEGEDYSEEDQTSAQMPDFPKDFAEARSTKTMSFVSDNNETEFAELRVNSNSEDDASVNLESLESLESLDSLDLDITAPTTEAGTVEAAQSVERTSEMEESIASTATPTAAQAMGAMPGVTQLQIQKAILLHLQSNTTIEIPSDLDVVHFGKPNDQIPPDVDVSGFPDSEVVSRIHADIRIEGDAYFVEDTGSSNGTYINHAPLHKGNRHRLRSGDRLALGKGDLVTFIFQLS